MNRRVNRSRGRKKQIFINRLLVLLILVLLVVGFMKFKPLIKDIAKDLGSIFGTGLGKDTEEPDIEIDDNEPIIKEPDIRNIEMVSVGDIMFHAPQLNAANMGNGVYDFAPPFEYIKPYVESADLALANFETVTPENGRAYEGYPLFNSPKESILALKETGFDILSTANNHTLDQGKVGVLNTLKYIEEYGLKSVGTYSQPNPQPLIEEVNGIKFGFLAYTYGLNGLDSRLTQEELSYMINLIDEEKIEKDIRTMKDLDVDMVVVSIHWGNEYQRQPSDYQIELGHKMVDWGANIILGSHPHVLQKSEIIKKDGRDNFIIYSMGNFISNQRQETMGNSYAEDGVIVRLNIEKDMDENKTRIKDVEFIPTWVHKYFVNQKPQYRVLPLNRVIDGDLDIVLSDTVLKRVKKSFNDSMETLGEIKQ